MCQVRVNSDLAGFLNHGVMALMCPVPSWIDAVHSEYSKDWELQDMRCKFTNGQLDLTRYINLMDYGSTKDVFILALSLHFVLRSLSKCMRVQHQAILAIIRP